MSETMAPGRSPTGQVGSVAGGTAEGAAGGPTEADADASGAVGISAAVSPTREVVVVAVAPARLATRRVESVVPRKAATESAPVSSEGAGGVAPGLPMFPHFDLQAQLVQWRPEWRHSHRLVEQVELMVQLQHLLHWSAVVPGSEDDGRDF